MKRLSIVPLLTLCLVAAACSGHTGGPAIDLSKPHLTVQVAYDGATRYRPSFAIWAVDPVTGRRATLFVTNKAGAWAWGDKNPRPEALPVWNGLAKAERADVELDSVSTATPATGATLTLAVPEAITADAFDLYLEANASYDYNEQYPEAAGVNGQPSTVYRLQVDRQTGGASAPELIGTGDVTGASDTLAAVPEGVTTAAALITGVTVSYSDGN